MVVHSCHPPVEGKSTSDKTTYSLEEFSSTRESEILPPFDSDAIEFLDPMVPFHKISSSDITNTPFLRHIASKKKPVVLSTGASTLSEIEDAVEILYSNNYNNVILLQCILNYPTKFSNANLSMMNSLASAFPNCHIGLSDHTLADENMLVLTTAYAMGARVIEKHYTFDKTIQGGDLSLIHI